MSSFHQFMASPTPYPLLLPCLTPKDSPPLKQLLLQLLWAKVEVNIIDSCTSRMRNQDPHIQAVDSGSCSSTCPVIRRVLSNGYSNSRIFRDGLLALGIVSICFL